MKISLIQSSPKLNRSNLHDVLYFVDQHQHSDVVVFSELSLSGYMLQDKLYEDAWNVEELEPLCTASEVCDIVIGAALWDEGKVYNSALYFSGGKLLHIHHKNHLPTYGMFEEGRYFAHGETIQAYETSYGRSVMVVCEDLWRADTLSKIAEQEVDVIYVLAASPARGFEEDGLSIEAQWGALLSSAAILTHAYVVFVNRVGFEDGLGFWGGSRVITPNGLCEYKLEKFEEQTKEVVLSHHLQKLEKYLTKNS